MSEFSPADAALEGFRLSRENPVGLAIWTVVFLVAIFAMKLLLVRTGAATAMTEFTNMTTAPGDDPTASLEVMRRLLPGYLLAILPVQLAQVFIQAGILRVALRPSGDRAYLSLGADELRIFGAFVMVTLLGAVAGMTVAVVSSLLTMANVALGIMAMAFGLLAVAVLIGVRFCLIYAVAIAERSINLGEAWRLVRGRFWPVFGAMVLSVAFFFIVLLLGSVVAYALRAATGVDLAATTVTAGSLFHPGELAASVVEALLQTLGLVLVTAPTAAIYRAIRKSAAAAVF
jgi:hypothetical protein